MSINQFELDKMIMRRNRGESYLSPLKYTPIYYKDEFYKYKLHGNYNFNFNNPMLEKNIGYLDIQHEYLKEKKASEISKMRNYFQNNLNEKQMQNLSKNNEKI